MPVTSRTYAMSTTTIGAVILRDDWTCAYCSRRLHEDQVVFDHVIPRVDGGSSRPYNIVVACHRCNWWKGDGAIPVHAVGEVHRRLSLPLDREAGRELGDRLYPWAADYRAREAAKSLARYYARQDRGRGLEGIAFPFGALAEGAS